MEEGFEIVYLKFPIAHKLMGEFRVEIALSLHSLSLTPHSLSISLLLHSRNFFSLVCEKQICGLCELVRKLLTPR
ncbi:hypothetical protein P8452_61283 [Trifolium repens]|nr:hypothetical protein P8452_61283 [Trifolium repens]